MHALVMEYIEGPAIDDKEKILADGYDMVEIDVMEVNLLVTYKGSIGDSRHDALNRKSYVKNKYNNCLVTCKQQWYNVKSLSGQKNIYGGTVRKRKAV